MRSHSRIVLFQPCPCLLKDSVTRVGAPPTTAGGREGVESNLRGHQESKHRSENNLNGERNSMFTSCQQGEERDAHITTLLHLSRGGIWADIH